VSRTIWALAWPVIATFALESLVGLVDTLMVGRLGASAVAAVGIGAQILSFVHVVMTAVGTGTFAVVARRMGAGERPAAEEALRQSILAAAVLSAAVVLPVVALAPVLVRAFGVDEPVVVQGAPFVRRVMLAVPAGSVVFVIGSALRAAGDTRTPLLVGALVNVVNVAGNWVLIFGKLGFPALGVVGSATATVVAFNLGAAVGLVLLLRGDLKLGLRRGGWRLRRRVVRRVLAVGVPAAAEQLLMQIGFFVYLVFAARHGTSAVAAYFIGVRILALSFLPGLGFAAAAATLVGQHLGAGTPERATASGWAASRLALLLMSAAGAVIFAFAAPIARAFVDDPAVVADAVSFIRVLAAAQPLMAVDYALGGALRGAGDTRFPLVAVVVGFYGARLLFAWAAVGLGADLFWVWFALLPDYVARGALKAWRFRSGGWQHVVV
jgi:putative MATE family efflux protein